MREFELKFQVPPARRAEVLAALRHGPVAQERLQARYFDTPQRALQHAAMVLRLRKEGRRWVQTVKCADGRGAFDRLEHNVPTRAGAGADIALHDGTPVAPLLQAAFDATGETAADLQPVFATDIVRITRTVTTAQTEVELALDEGRLLLGQREQPVLELEFELKAGLPSALIELAQEWCARHGLWLDPQSKAMAASRLAATEPPPPVMAGAAKVARDAQGSEVIASVLGSALEQVLGNAREVAAGQATDKHVHQLRVGLRRLRSVLRELQDLPELASVPATVQDQLTMLFRQLGEHRDALVLVPELERQLAAAHAPPLARDPVGPLPDIAAAVRDTAFQSAVLAIVAAQQRLLESPQAPATGRKALRKAVTRRLRKLRAQSLEAGRDFAALAEPDRHRVRKRLKRLRYLGELMRSLYPGRKVDRFVDALKDLQDTLGQYQDAAVGRRLWTEQAKSDPNAWFGAGWLAAREEQLARSCEQACRAAFADATPFWKGSRR
jgi:triphosphatase